MTKITARFHNDSSARHQTKHAAASAAGTHKRPKVTPNAGTPDTRSANQSGPLDGFVREITEYNKR